MDRTAGLLIILMVALGVFGIISTGQEDGDHPGEGNTAKVRFEEGLVIECELATNESERVKGLMDRHQLGDNEGMLFVYDPPEPASIWMKGTYIDLDIVFISEDNEVMLVREAKAGAGVPDSELPVYQSNGYVAYILEMNRGLAERYGIGPGSSVEIEM